MWAINLVEKAPLLINIVSLGLFISPFILSMILQSAYAILSNAQVPEI
jgi:hypothetical protein